MAGSLSHITDRDGSFSIDLIENMGDAYEALEECFFLIRELSEGDTSKVSVACNKLNYPDPYDKDE